MDGGRGEGRRAGSVVRRLRCAGSLALALVGVLLPACGPPSAGPRGTVRNVVLVSLDTLRADHLGLYGYARDTSPELDAFAAGGFVFERALAPAPNTPPSQMSMMTSLYPGRHGFTGKVEALGEGIETLAQHMKRAGFRTAGFVDGGYLRGFFGFDRGFDAYDDAGGGFAEILPRVRRWLEVHDAEPFFLFVHSYDIHAPYLPPAPYAGMFHERPYTGELVPTSERIDAIWRGAIELGAGDMQHLVDSYDEGIRYADAQLGGLLRFLEERGRLGDTAVIVTSDHGEEFGEHGSVSHWQLYYQPNLRVPLVVRLPRGAPGPVRIAGQVELIDVAPTILDLVGAEPLAAAQGRSLAPLLSEPGERPSPPSPSEPGRGALAWWPDPDQLPLRSLVLDDHQLLFNVEVAGRDQLYDLSADPMAQHDLAASQPGRVARLRALGLQGMRENQPVPAARLAPRMRIDRRTLEQLEALGYRR